jgi:hypothetical protein
LFCDSKTKMVQQSKNFLFGRKTTILCNLTVTSFGIGLESGAVTTHSFNCRVESISLIVAGKRSIMRRSVPVAQESHTLQVGGSITPSALHIITITIVSTKS